MDAFNVTSCHVASRLSCLLDDAARDGNRPPRLLADSATVLEALADACQRDTLSFPYPTLCVLDVGEDSEQPSQGFLDAGSVQGIVDLLRRGAGTERIELDTLRSAAMLLRVFSRDRSLRGELSGPVITNVFGHWPALRLTAVPSP